MAAIEKMPEPEDKAGVRRFLGVANYFSRFVPGLADMDTPLRKLTHQDSDFNWTTDCMKAFCDMKSAISNAGLLRYFNPDKRSLLQCDASSTGLGAVLMQQGEPVAYASRALTGTERNLCQLQKEMLALVFATNRFRLYIYGIPVEIETDHKPLEVIFRRPLQSVLRRLQRMTMELQRFDVTAVYRRGSELYVADTLSRAYLSLSGQACNREFDKREQIGPSSAERNIDDVSILQEVFGISDQLLAEVIEHTQRDPVMWQLIEVIQVGWPHEKRHVAMNLRPYFDFRDELLTENGLVLRGNSCVLPLTLRQTLLQKLHSSHLGVGGTLRRARESICWPRMNSDIKSYVEHCETCAAVKVKAQQKELLHPQSAFETVGQSCSRLVLTRTTELPHYCGLLVKFLRGGSDGKHRCDSSGEMSQKTFRQAWDPR